MMDGDGQHAAEDIPRLLAEAGKGTAKLIIGNRMHQPGAMPSLRRWANRWLSARISELAGVAVPDSQCGFRLAHLRHWLLSPCIRGTSRSSRRCAWPSRQPAIGYPSRPCRRATVSSAGESPLRDYWRWWRWYQEARALTGGAALRWSPPRQPQAVRTAAG
jgi:hypothetical protein